MVVKLYIGETRLDLFQDENIEVTSSITNSSDVTKNTTDYSQAFTVPASNVNNQVFKHYYNANIDNTFDARSKVNGRIELDGIPYKRGKWRLEKVNVKKGKPSSYTITFFGSLVSLVDILGKDELTDLDLSEFDHLYNSANVQTGLTSSLFSGDVVYNLLPKKRYIYNSNVSDTTQTAELSNIAVTGTANGVTWSDLKPSIRAKRIIEAIESKYSINFSNNFFGRTEFLNLFVWLNNGIGSQGEPTEQLINWDSGNGGDFGLSNATDTWINTQTLTALRYSYRITITPTDLTIPYKVVVKNYGVPVAEFTSEGGVLVSDLITIPLNNFQDTPFEYKFYLSSSTSMEYSASILLRRNGGIPNPFDRQSFASSNTLIDLFNVAANLPKLKIIDFLTGLFKMFKLVIFQEGNDIYINTLNDYYTEGVLRDITKYVDFESVDVSRGKLLNNINFSFEDPTTILNDQFLKNTGDGYGDEELILLDEDGKPLDGESLEYKIPFEQVIFERLNDIDGNDLTTIQYGAIIDENLAPANPKTLLFYNSLVSISTNNISFINDTNTQVILSGNINTPAHCMPITNQVFSTLFGAEFNTYDGTIVTNTLYTNYHKDYIESIFNIKRRSFAFKGILPLQILSTLKLNDVLKIKDNYYRIDNFTLNLINGESKLNLINSFDNTLRTLAADTTAIFVDFREQSRTVYTRFVNPIIVDFDGTSFGVGWLSGSQNGNIVTVEFDENLSSATRDAYLWLTDSVTLERITIYLNQSE